jgi:hypothetical protein
MITIILAFLSGFILGSSSMYSFANDQFNKYEEIKKKLC